MEHLITLQIKTMPELGKIKKKKELLDSEHGIGSEDQKDKGAFKDALSTETMQADFENMYM